MGRQSGEAECGGRVGRRSGEAEWGGRVRRQSEERVYRNLLTSCLPSKTVKAANDCVPIQEGHPKRADSKRKRESEYNTMSREEWATPL